MSFLRPLCRLCERPTADGAVQAIQVDREKLQTWFSNIHGVKLTEEIKDADLICYFCIWHAELLVKHVSQFKSLAWWPPNSDYMDSTARELHEKYFDGEAEQCWVQLENIELPESDSETDNEDIAEPRSPASDRRACFYCGEEVVFKSLSRHIYQNHEDAIRCEYANCATYFHSVKERDNHTKEVHGKARKSQVLKCPPRNNFKCFNIELVHKRKDEAKGFKCPFCEYKGKGKSILLSHISFKHMPKNIECRKCDKTFATKRALAVHEKQKHTYWVCMDCGSDVDLQSRRYHLRRVDCNRCKHRFECFGLFSAHKNSCKQRIN